MEWSKVSNLLSLGQNFIRSHVGLWPLIQCLVKPQNVKRETNRYFPELEPRWVRHAQPAVPPAALIVAVVGGGGGAAGVDFDIRDNILSTLTAVADQPDLIRICSVTNRILVTIHCEILEVTLYRVGPSLIRRR